MKTEQLENLKDIQLLIIHPGLSAMGAALIMAYSDLSFKQNKNLFYNNPAKVY
jgi:hypothetical protein